MRDDDRPLTRAAAWRRAWGPALLGWIVGTAVQLGQPALWPGWGYGGLALAALVASPVLARAGRRGAIGGWWVLPVAAVLAFAVAGGRAVVFAEQALAPVWDGAAVQAVWRVTAMPRRATDGTWFEAQVLEARTPGGEPVRVAGQVRLGWRLRGPTDDGAPPLRVAPGETWRGMVRLRAPRGLANPHGFDTEAWLWREGIVATGSVLDGGRREPPRRIADDAWRHPVERARTAVRDAIMDRLEPRHGAAATGLVAALVTGDQGAIPPTDWAAIRATGVAHLVAISGLHVTMFAVVATVGVGAVWRAVGRRRPGWLLRWPVPVAAGAGGVALATAYALFAGWGVPAQRTVTMLAVVVALRLSGRRWPWPATWLAAMAVALVLDPWALLQPGFWLSFVAVAVLFSQGPPAWQPAGRAARLWQALRSLLRVQVVITLALAPLTLLLFGQVSVVGLLANVVAIPWVTWALTPLALAGTVLAPLWDAAAGLARGLLGVLHAMAAWPGAVWERPALPLPLAALAGAGAVLLVWRVPWRWRSWGLWLLWPALAYQPPVPPPGAFEVLLPDVGQGSAAIVRTARHTLVFDSGPPIGRGDAAERVLLPWLRALGATPDAIVISHDDSDHAGGLPTLSRAYPSAAWWTSFDPGDRHAGAVRTCSAGVSWEWDGVRFAFLHPPTPDWVPPRQGGDNARSCVLRVGEGERAALLTGDIRQEEESALVSADPALRTGLLVAAHHGSRTSTGPVWLDTLRPHAVVVQAGWRNRYGHPHPAVLQRLQARGIPWVDTATCGAVTWRSTAPASLACERERAPRYWHGVPHAGAVRPRDERPWDPADEGASGRSVSGPSETR